ncbi:NAD(P)-dependent dehydrogenase (short-subunit alcohol dehydrogenase family) [Jatrophihabitans sp. GAS493]|uniref:SDR family NAD(P)-dependent oxidoreductase n=1 Tax=Jatrophihabitans sp. GAS493 TaxID=1907575 RepID=UPI000BB8F1B1|nr:SDR family NAD(P)-dependent oxidoreductase [Jatrophihabitans sp. GAS493]SOD74627.1 NAD(P)-dependent dehydrogenase (short-subunit alcohol dehydrogenase family) [Jatrophihabitans sp. GAS493]
MTSLSGRTVVITGGNRGIGLGLAEGVARAGAAVVILARDEVASAAAVQRLGVHGVAVHSFACDVSDETQVALAFAQAIERAGPIHAVFANAGISSVAAPFHEQSTEEWHRVMAVNVDGVVATMRAAVAHMLEHGEGGALVAVSSIAARHGMRNFAPYSASKAAVVALMQTIAIEYARAGIRSNVLLPGWVDTDLTSQASEKLRGRIVARTPLGRFGRSEDFAAVAAFLADPTQIFHTGESIVLDGGYLKT